MTVPREALDEARSEEPAAAGDENAHRGKLARDERFLSSRPKSIYEVRSEKTTTAGDEDAGHVCTRSGVSQSTRPIHRSRFSAYQRIVRSTPSSHDTFGSQPVSRFSFS